MADRFLLFIASSIQHFAMWESPAASQVFSLPSHTHTPLHATAAASKTSRHQPSRRVPYLRHVAVRLRCHCLAALHGGRWRGRRGEALGSDGGHLEQRHGLVEVHGDLGGHAVRGGGLQADRQGPPRALHGVVVLQDAQLRGGRAQRRCCGGAWGRLGWGLTFRWVCGGGDHNLRTANGAA